MKSMTGYSFCEKQTPENSVSVEIKSYNSRFLEISINLHSLYNQLEPRIRSLISSSCVRGKIEVSIRVKRHNENIKININKSALGNYIENIKQTASSLKDNSFINNDMPLSFLLGLDGIIEIEKDSIDENAAWDLIKDIFNEALLKFDIERKREGEFTKNNILALIEIIETNLHEIESLIPRTEALIKENIQNRFLELFNNTNTNITIDENRILSETAILLMRWTIAEEVSRLKSHLNEFKAEIARNESPGKKLDFLCQEINREVNTIGSKTQVIEVSRAVVAIKDALENVREQLRNVE